MKHNKRKENSQRNRILYTAIWHTIEKKKKLYEEGEILILSIQNSNIYALNKMGPLPENKSNLK